MSDLTVDNMFTPTFYELRRVIDGSLMGPVGNKRLLAHAVADVTQEILSAPGANPLGLTVTVTAMPGPSKGHPNLLVTATCPQYELTESFFD